MPAGSHDTKAQYQKIYEEFAWYGNAAEDRCPGVRLLPHYQHWLLEPVLDLGCGRGHAVEALRTAGVSADGIDQVAIHPAMKVGDITRPLEFAGRYRSVSCIDCVEHLDDAQVAGLFANMLRVERQAFSIHNGPSAATGEELHVNRKPFDEWNRIVEAHFAVREVIPINRWQVLYLTETPRSS